MGSSAHLEVLQVLGKVRASHVDCFPSAYFVCVGGGGKGPTHYSSVRSKLTYFFLFGLSLELSQSPPLAWTEGLCRL